MTFKQLSADQSKEANKIRRNAIARSKRQYGAIRTQDSYHGARTYSTQIFTTTDSKLVADINLSR